MIPSLLALALAAPAHACPTVATGTPNALPYDMARTAIVRQGTRTTFTVSINPQGDQQQFALVMPVPGVLAEGDVRTVDAEVFTRLDGQTGLLTIQDAGCSYPSVPYRHPCPQDYGDGADGSDGTDGSDGSGGGAYGDVQVEAEYRVGSYEVAILSATESSDLFRYLGDHGYHLSDPTVPVLQDYLDEGMMFLTARVSEEATAADGASLTPLQIAYDSEMFGIPIRLAAASSPGQQDMLIYAVTAPEAGRVGISNYPELTVEDSCIWNLEGSEASGGTFGEFYEGRFDAAWQAADQAGWAVEWGAETWGCNPCSGVQTTEEDLAALGWSGGVQHHLTRLHVRYTPETAHQDLVLYESGMRDHVSMTFANDHTLNRQCRDACQADLQDDLEAWRAEFLAQEQATRDAWEQEQAEDCAEDAGHPWQRGDATGDDDDDGDRASGCAVAPAAPLAAVSLAGLLAVGRRRP